MASNAVEPLPTAALTAPPPKPGAKTAAALDTTTAEQKAAALVAPEPPKEQALGNVVVALGNVTEPGFWLRSSLGQNPQRRGR